jgi:hypothetical protein
VRPAIDGLVQPIIDENRQLININISIAVEVDDNRDLIG